jgi:hypothetical protein
MAPSSTVVLLPSTTKGQTIYTHLNVDLATIISLGFTLFTYTPLAPSIQDATQDSFIIKSQQ